MKRLRLFWNDGINWLRKEDNRFLVVFFTIILGILYLNAFHESYPDEFDNILGGWNILHGVLLYRDFFTHHGPVAYYLSAFITLLGGQSFVHFRVIFSVMLFIYFVATYWYLRSRFGKEKTVFYLVFTLLIALAANYYWLHMVLADTLSAYFLAPVVAILLVSSYFGRLLLKRDIVVISLLIALTVLSSLTFLYLSLILYAFAFYLYIKPLRKKQLFREGAICLAIFAAPYVFHLFFLLITSSLKDYLYESIIFNQKYYIYNYPRPEGVTSINPLRYAIVIAHSFYNSYYTLLQQAKDFNFGYPLNITFAIGTLGAVIYLCLKRYYLLGTFIIGCLIYANTRSAPLTSKETDYQSAVYIAIAMLIIPFIISRIYKEVQERESLTKNAIPIALLLLISVYTLFSSLFLISRFFNRTYDKYMGMAPLIYDYPQVAPILNKIVTKDETVWIGPFDFEEIFYTNAKPASKYQIFIPGMGMATELHQPFLDEFERTKPALIYFAKDFNILGRSPEVYGQFFIDYLKDKYILLMDYEKDGVKYSSTIPKSGRVDLEGRVYLRKEKADDVISRMLVQNLIHEKVK